VQRLRAEDGQGGHNSKCSSVTEQRSKGVQASEGKEEGKGKGRGRRAEQARQGHGMAGKTRQEERKD